MHAVGTSIRLAPDRNRPPPSVSSAAGKDPTTGRAKRRILVVEDEALVAMQIVAILEETGYEAVWLAASGNDALSECRRWVPDLVLMDIMLREGTDGVRAADEIRKQLGIASIFVSASTDGGTLARAREVGVGFVRKPFDPAALLKAVAGVFAKPQ